MNKETLERAKGLGQHAFELELVDCTTHKPGSRWKMTGTMELQQALDLLAVARGEKKAAGKP